jgi:hypothetical protein
MRAPDAPSIVSLIGSGAVQLAQRTTHSTRITQYSGDLLCC